jgi:hypothetical protein
MRYYRIVINKPNGDLVIDAVQIDSRAGDLA